MRKVVIDTSVFVAGLLSKSKTSSSVQILAMWRSGAFSLVMSPQIMREIVAKLYEKGIPDHRITELVAVMAKTSLFIPGAYEATKLDKIDATDNMFLAAAYEAGADFIVSCDKKSLLPMKHFHGTQIRSPDLFLRAFAGLTEQEAQDEALQEDIESDEKT